MDKKIAVYTYIYIYTPKTFVSFLMRWIKLEAVIQSKVSQKEKHK